MYYSCPSLSHAVSDFGPLSFDKFSWTHKRNNTVFKQGLSRLPIKINDQPILVGGFLQSIDDIITQAGVQPGNPRQFERGIGFLLKPAKYSKIWSRHFAESAT